MKQLNILALASFTLLAGTSFAQKKNETDAALAVQAIEKCLYKSDFEGIKKAALEGKTSIDLAAAHPDTQNSPKTIFLTGEIYGVLGMFRGKGDATFDAATPENSFDIALKAYKRVYTESDKYDEEVRGSIDQYKQLLYAEGSALFEAKKYPEAMKSFAGNAELSGVIGKMDTTAIYYAGISAENALDWDNAAKYYRQCADAGYKPETIYRTTAVAYINGKKNDQALAFLKESIAKSPKDKYLYFAMGTIAMEMNEDQVVMESLTKATEIDPKYADAFYNLGSYFSGKGMELRSEASNLPVTERAKSDQLYNQSLEFYKMAATPLEKYIELSPKDIEVVKSLFQIFRALKDTEKEAKYKAMYDALK